MTRDAEVKGFVTFCRWARWLGLGGDTVFVEPGLYGKLETIVAAESEQLLRMEPEPCLIVAGVRVEPLVDLVPA